MVRVVTRLRAVGANRVAVELDGTLWRTLPAEIVVKAGLGIGVALDRERARSVGMELRRTRALSTALRALGRRDHSRQSLADQLGRANIRPQVAAGTLETLERVGLVDDSRAARERAIYLAGRDGGDALIRDDLERCGFTPGVVELAIDALEPESERAARIVARRGSAPGTFRRLAAKGFADEVIESLIARTGAHELG